MDAELKVESSLEHDGDGCVRFVLAFHNRFFSAKVLAWGNTEDHLALADALTGFPSSASSRVSYSFGTAGTGACSLEFFCTDNLGHVGVWSTLEAEHPVGRTAQHESARIFMRSEPSAVDSFVASLRRFAAGHDNVATLPGLGP